MFWLIEKEEVSEQLHDITHDHDSDMANIHKVLKIKIKSLKIIVELHFYMSTVVYPIKYAGSKV